MTDRDQAQVAGQRPVPSPDTGEQSGEVAPALVANPARIYDYLLGGKDNYAADRLAAQRAIAAIPEIRKVAKANRRFLVRAVRFAAEQSITQFIDLGTGFPTSPNVHEVARGTCPHAKIIYVDNDPVVTAHNRALRATVPGVVAIKGDIRDPDEVLANRELTGLIDFTVPVAVLFVAVLHFIRPEEDPARIVAAFAERMAAGSYLVVSHGVSDDTDPGAVAGIAEAYGRSGVTLVPRTVAEVGSWFGGFELIRPGLVDVTQWYPGQTAKPGPVRVVAGAGRRQ
jgi:hypothetical protein